MDLNKYFGLGLSNLLDILSGSVSQELTMIPHYFFKHSTNSITILLVYVDDIVRTGTDRDLINRLISQLYSVFEIKDLGSLNHFLGIEVSRDSSSLFLSQTNMLETFLHGLICCTVSHMAQMQLPRQVLLFLPLLWPIYPNTEV